MGSDGRARAGFTELIPGPGSMQEFSIFPAPLPVLMETVGHDQVAKLWGQAPAPGPWGKERMCLSIQRRPSLGMGET